MKFQKSIAAIMSLCILTGGCITPSAFAADTPASGTVIVTKYGDATVDGKVDVSDAVLVARFAASDRTAVITDTGRLNADVNLDGNTDSEDVTQILEFIAKKRTSLGNEDANSAQGYHKYSLTENLTANPVQDIPLDDAFIKSQYDLTAKLMREISFSDTEHENILISPLSIATALSLVANGAEGDTADELNKFLVGDLNPTLLNDYYHNYLSNLPSSDKAKLHLANSLWNSEELSIRADYLQTVKDYYGDMDVFKAPFTDTTLKDINNWISDKTEGRIKEMLKSMNGNAVTYLINALAFDAEWENAWKETVKGEFADYNETAKTVDMMKGTEKYYISDQYAEGFIKQYSGGTYSFVGILPRESLSVTLSDYIGMMDTDSLRALIDSRTEEAVSVTMPKFKYDYDTGETLLGQTLQKLGVNKAFTPMEADFGRLYEEDPIDVYISRVLHNTFIDVNEKGTEAAAATVVEFVRKGGEAPSLNFNRPFIFMILDERTKLPVFIGSVKNPQSDAEEAQQQQNDLQPGKVRFTVVDDKTGEPIELPSQGTPLGIETNIEYDTPNGRVSTGPIIAISSNPHIEDNFAGFFNADYFGMRIEEYTVPAAYRVPNNALTWVKHDNGSYDVTVKLQYLGELKENEVRFTVVDLYTRELIPLSEQNMMIVESGPKEFDPENAVIGSPVFGLKENPAIEKSGAFARLCSSDSVELTVHNTLLPEGYELPEAYLYKIKHENGSYDVVIQLKPITMVP